MLFNIGRRKFGSWSYIWNGSEDISWGESGSDWMMAIPVSGTLVLTAAIMSADICIVGGGDPGKNGVVSNNPNGSGGNGGEVVEATNISLPAGTYTVAIGGSGQDTVLAAPDGRSWTAEHGGGSAGAVLPNYDGTDGVLAWSDPATIVNTGWKYGGGGGHGETHTQQGAHHNAGSGGSVGAASADTTVGHGGYEIQNVQVGDGYAGCANTGQGGGGGRYWYNSGYQSRDGGAGGSGIILIRKHKEVS